MAYPFSSLKTRRAQFLVECLDLPGASGVEDARWEHFQIDHLNDDSLFRIDVKSRQVAWSFTAAMEAVAEAVLDGRGSIFVSINLDEAKEKIRYARSIYEHLQIGDLPRIKQDNQLMIELVNGARLISLPSKPPRGKPRMNVYGDEFAHVQRDRQIYTAMLPVISKGGRIRLGSSPLGASGMFWEIFSEKQKKYPGYTRKRTPWWEVQSFCLNVREARKLAPEMETFARVEMFGNDRIKANFANMLLEDFQQEYEAEFVDETTAWISWEEIQESQDSRLTCHLATAQGKDMSRVFDAISQVARLVKQGLIELVLVAGMDVGRTRNTSEIFLVGLSTTNSYPLRLAITLDNVEFDDQFEVIFKLMTELPITRMLIDRNGIGRNIAENASKKFPAKVEGVDFTNETKRLWATDAKMLIQQHRTPLPCDRDIAYQIHSIKRTVTSAKNLVFDTARNEKHHADKFWGWALALAAAVMRTDTYEIKVL
ncbi:MAG: terminase family protein [Pyrinomonadaceae bacterium]